MHRILHVLDIAREELRYFMRHRRLLAATLIACVVPALYALIYLSSVWDPESKTRALQVGIVNLDAGIDYQERHFNLGNEVFAALEKRGRFGYVPHTDAEQARRFVRQGKLAFALILPEDFSANAIPGMHPGAGRPEIFVSEGNNFETAAIARRFALTLDQQVNEELNAQRWLMVLTEAAGSQQNVDRLRAAIQQLTKGARQLGEGAHKTQQGSEKLAHGSVEFQQNIQHLLTNARALGDGLRAMDAQRPAEADLTRLRNGSNSLVAGHEALSSGFEALRTGTQQLRSGITTLRQETENALFLPDELDQGIAQLVEGAEKLDGAMQTASDAQGKLTGASRQLRAANTRVLTGLRTLSDGIHNMSTQLPAEAQLDALQQGSAALSEGAQRLAQASRQITQGAEQINLGLTQITSALPGRLPRPEGSPQGLAHSVSPVLNIEAPVQNSGSGLAPNLLAGALWLGAGIAAFLMHVRVLPRQARDYGRFARVFGKLTLPAGVVLVQVAVVYALVAWIMAIRIAHPGAFVFTMMVSALTFLTIVFALTCALGDAGKGLAMILLAVQLSSSGGIVPVELSGHLFVDISPWLPLTWVVRALKACMFGAYDAVWLSPLLWVMLWGTAALLVAAQIARWRFVASEEIRPAIEL